MKNPDRASFVIAQTILALQELKDVGLIELDTGYDIIDLPALQQIITTGLQQGQAVVTPEEFSQAINEIQLSLDSGDFS